MSDVEKTRLRSLAAVARATDRSNPLMELLELAAEQALVAVGAASVSVSRLEPGAGVLRTLLNVGALGPTEKRLPEDETYELAEFSHLRGLIDEPKPWTVSLHDEGSDVRDRELLRELAKGSAVGFPIVIEGRTWGELYATRLVGEPAMGPAELDYLDALTAILAGSVQRAVREDALAELAYRDALTGLPNRRMLDLRAAQAFDVPPGAVRQVTAVAVDIGGLERVNESHGHAVGDQLIQAVSGSLQRIFAPLAGSLVARVGGDEFVVLTVGHPVGLVKRVADELCRRTWTFGSPISVSCGAASLQLRAGSPRLPRELFAAADRAQHAAGSAGLDSTLLDDDLQGLPEVG